MALESPTSAGPAVADATVAIDNEIPAYRAIHPLAVISLLLGVLSVLCFANIWFATAAALAVAAGLYADWQIRRLPDVFTGRGLAQAGVTLALIFSLSSATIGQVQTAILKRDSAAFGRRFAQVLRRGNFAETFSYRAPADRREKQTPEELINQMTGGGDANNEFERHAGSTRLFVKRVNEGRAVRYAGIEQSGYDDLVGYAFLLYELEGKPDATVPELSWALIEARTGVRGRNDWYVKEFVYPYKRKTHALAPKATDDGHGHSH